MRTEHVIKLAPADIQRFVNTASKCDFDIDIASDGYNNQYVDAKSILGVMSLNLRGNLVVSYSGYNADFENLIRGCAIAC